MAKNKKQIKAAPRKPPARPEFCPHCGKGLPPPMKKLRNSAFWGKSVAITGPGTRQVFYGPFTPVMVKRE